MNVLMGVYFNSPHGGLHDNVISSVEAVLGDGGSVTVLCKPGAFADTVKDLGCSVLETNFSTLSFGLVVDLLDKINSEKPFDVIHTHPFLSREILLYFSRKKNIPLILTLHGQYDDELETYWNDVEIILTVSEGIKDFVAERVESIEREKLHVLHNAVSNVYSSSTVDRSVLRELPESKVITFVTRFDADKQFILDVGLEAIKWSSSSHEKIFWQFIGDGNLLSDFKEKVRSLINKSDFAFSGWLTNDELAEKYRESYVVIGPGRCAIDALACGSPVIAIGSKGYIGLIDETSWFNGVYSNFGGVGSRHKSYESGSISKDLNRLLTMSGYSKYLGELGPRLAKTFFNTEEINTKLINLYGLSACRALGSENNSENKELWHPKHGLIRIELCVIGSSEVSVEIIHSRVDSYSFAWYEYTNDNISHTHNYTGCPIKVFSFGKAGKYAIRCFLKDKHDSKISFMIVEVEKKDFEEKIKLQSKVEDAEVSYHASEKIKTSVLKSLNFSRADGNIGKSSAVKKLEFTK
jgi:glycosyltransferase involved in cell wall biosynthesis